LYNWFAIREESGLVPEGYRIPTLSDVNTLIDYLGGPKYAAVKLEATVWEEYAYLELYEKERKNN